MAIWRHAAEAGHCSPPPRVAKAREPLRIPNAWSLEQVRDLFAACDRLPGWWEGGPVALYSKMGLSVIWDTACRVNELMCAGIVDVDLRRKIWHVPAEHRKGWRSDREYSLHSDTCELIRLTLAYPRERLFPFPFDHRQIWIHLHKILRLAGLPIGRRFGFHCLRRTAESYAAKERGIESAAAAVGHGVEVARRSYIAPAIVGEHRLIDAIPRPSSMESKEAVESIVISSVPSSAKRIELDARRKAGETIVVMRERGELAEHGGDRKSKSHAATLISLEELDLTKSESSRYQAEAADPIAIPDVAVPLAENSGPGRVPTLSTAARRHRRPRHRRNRRSSSAGPVESTRPLPHEPQGTL